ncbi:MAG TPA: hypothetical protein VGJ84_01450 [Polyangiaceae bacterium]|jgi:hypothetical protein
MLRAAWREDSRRRRLLVAAGIYLFTSSVYFALAPRALLLAHTPWNHYALLADNWLHGRLDLGGSPPEYAGRNDFSSFGGKWYVTFPPFPALLLLPLVKIAGSPERMRDGQFFLWLAGIGPAVVFLGLEKLRRTGRAEHGVQTNAALSLLFAFGTVYFFTAEQGTVWYAAHVVGVSLTALYLLFALDAERPFLAGAMLALGFMTRPPLLFAVPLFALEAWRKAATRRTSPKPNEPPTLPLNLRALLTSLQRNWASVDQRRLLKLYAAFSAPLLACWVVAGWMNAARFGNPFDFGYRHLVVTWTPRMQKWGLFDYHYLAKNLGVLLTDLPWRTPHAPAPFQINSHGLPLWFTTPVFLCLLWPRRVSPLHPALWATVALVAVPTLFYQNTGWVQFGYRFSNDYAVFLFALLAIGGYRLRSWFWSVAAIAVLINAFGAVTFGRPEYAAYYFQDNTQGILYQPD